MVSEPSTLHFFITCFPVPQGLGLPHLNCMFLVLKCFTSLPNAHTFQATATARMNAFSKWRPSNSPARPYFLPPLASEMITGPLTRELDALFFYPNNPSLAAHAPPIPSSSYMLQLTHFSLASMHPNTDSIGNVFANVMPNIRPTSLVQRGQYLTSQQVPAKKENAQIIHLDSVLHIFDVKWADQYPGCKIVIELNHGTFPSAEQCAHLRKITRGDMVIFDDYEPGKGNHFTLDSHAFFPSIIAITAHLT